MDPGGLLLEKGARLVDGHVVCPHFADVFQGLSGQGHQVLLDTQIHLALDLPVILAQEFEIMDETARERVFDGHDGRIGHPGSEGPVQVLERVALDDGRGFLAGVERPGGLLMEAALVALYRYPFHGAFMKRAIRIPDSPT